MVKQKKIIYIVEYVNDFDDEHSNLGAFSTSEKASKFIDEHMKEFEDKEDCYTVVEYELDLDFDDVY